MTILNHILGFPRIGIRRELKKAQEEYWNGNSTKEELMKIGSMLRTRHWEQQKNAGIDLLSVGDFAWYDHVLTHSMMLGNIPKRHKTKNNIIDIDTLFRLARGHAPTGHSTSASEMTKWFNTNYHYIVPEFIKNQKFKFTWTQLLSEVDEALSLNYKIKPILLGPLTYLWLGKVKGELFDKLLLLDDILLIYKQIINKLIERNIEWLQIDEPILSLELPNNWCNAFQLTYENLYNKNIKFLLTTYFDSINKNIDFICKIPVQGLHIDCVHGSDNIYEIHKKLPLSLVLSLGVVNGRNVWRTDLYSWFKRIQPIIDIREQLWIGSSCSLLHTPIDLNVEMHLDEEVKSWFSFALQKCGELSLLKNSLNKNDISSLEEWSKPINARLNSKRVHNIQVKNRLQNISIKDYKRDLPYSERIKLQRSRLNLPILPTTTIGSFPQTNKIRTLRLDFKQGRLDIDSYKAAIAEHIKMIIAEQELLDLDVLVHGEPERNDMVEYFSEHLEGFIFTQNGWVQSYGSRCVKPPVIIGDVNRSKSITVEWAKYAQSLTNKPVKGMLTGPITILYWSFPREDITFEIIAKQIALALRDEIKDLENAGIGIIQIDEPALREGLPLQKSNWETYLKWTVNVFHLTTAVVQNTTQIHTHMCYCEFNDIINSIAKLDADVITIETSRSDMELLSAFKNFEYPNEIGPGVYDIHSPNIPSVESIENLLKKAFQCIPKERLWVNPDCGLKTRNWDETRKSLTNMVEAAKKLRSKNL